MTSPGDGADCHRSSRQSPVYAIIIPAYNEAQELPATLVAVRRAMAGQDLPGECIVVDNHSSDDTSAVAKAGGADRVVYEPVNQIARARNAGAAVTTANYLVFVDADTRIEAALLSRALELLQSKACVGGGAEVRFEDTPGLVGRFAIGLWKRISLLTRTAAGSFFFCRRDAFQAVGGFDEKLYAAEEVLLSRHLRKCGRKRGQAFVIITDPPVTTSARKLRWYSNAQLIGWIVFMMLMPFAVRSRRLCRFWYQRPGSGNRQDRQ